MANMGRALAKVDWENRLRINTIETTSGRHFKRYFIILNSDCEAN